MRRCVNCLEVDNLKSDTRVIKLFFFYNKNVFSPNIQKMLEVASDPGT